MENTDRQMEDEGEKRPKKHMSVGRVLMWCIGGVGAMVLIPMLFFICMGSFVYLYLSNKGEVKRNPSWSAGVELLTPKSKEVQLLSSHDTSGTWSRSYCAEYIIRLGSAEESESMVAEILRRNASAQADAQGVQPEQTKTYARFVAEYSSADAKRYVFDLYGGCPYGGPMVDAMLAVSGADDTWYVRHDRRPVPKPSERPKGDGDISPTESGR